MKKRRVEEMHQDQESRRETRQETRPDRNQIDDAPIVGKIYNGTVVAVKDFGCFVSLENVKPMGRRGVEGMVHISNMLNRR